MMYTVTHNVMCVQLCVLVQTLGGVQRLGRENGGGGGLSFGVHVLASAAEASVFKGVLIPGD